jgi:glycosyltransferase involved in cell wall biosynthesis
MFIIAHNAARIWGGAEIATARLLAGLRQRGHRVLLLCNEQRVAAAAEKIGIATEIVPVGGDFMFVDALRLARRLRHYKPDAFIIGTYRKLFITSLAARVAGVPRVFVRAGLETDTPRSAKYRYALSRWVNVVVVNASRMRTPFLSLPGWYDERVAFIPNGVPEPERRLPAGALRREFGIPPDANVVGTVARLNVQKRLDRLLSAMTLLDPRVHCMMAGTGPERDTLRDLVIRLGLTGRVHLLGHREDTGDVIAALDVMVVASDREGMSNSMLEALISGVPVISTPVSGADDALSPLPDGRRPGIVLETFDVPELARAIDTLLADEAGLASMRAAAHAKARAEFGVEQMLDRWECVLQRS